MNFHIVNSQTPHFNPPPLPPLYIGGVVIFEKSERGADQDFFVKMGEGVSIVCVFGGKGGVSTAFH